MFSRVEPFEQALSYFEKQFCVVVFCVLFVFFFVFFLILGSGFRSHFKIQICMMKYR